MIVGWTDLTELLEHAIRTNLEIVDMPLHQALEKFTTLSDDVRAAVLFLQKIRYTEITEK